VSLIALLLAFLIEHALTIALHLREPRWLDRYTDWIERQAGQRGGAWLIAIAGCAVLLPAVPVAVVSQYLGGRLTGLPELAFAVLVLLLSFGPRDLQGEVKDYLAALGRDDCDEANRRAKELLESDAVGRGEGLREAVEEAIFVQANNRIFGVMFWFMVAGPAGAWMFRVSDLMRRRAVFEAGRRGARPETGTFAGSLAFIHGLLAWVPARLVAGSYAVAGSFEDAVGSWRAAVDRVEHGLLDRSHDLLARVGKGSLQPSLASVPADGMEAATAAGAWRIVSRAIWFWLAVVALLVLAGSAR
jgi:AmpE protein